MGGVGREGGKVSRDERKKKGGGGGGREFEVTQARSLLIEVVRVEMVGFSLVSLFV